MVVGTDSLGDEKEACDKTVPNPHRDPSFPPGHPGLNTCGCNLPCIHVEGISNPKEDKIPPSPWSIVFIQDWLQILIDEELFTESQIRILLKRDLV
jgi:hypothetical protein